MARTRAVTWKAECFSIVKWDRLSISAQAVVVISTSCLSAFPDGEEEAGEQNEERSTERRVPGAA